MQDSRARCSLRRIPRALLCLAALSVGACDTVSDWFAGVDPENYVWEPMAGLKPRNSWDKDLQDCESPSLEAAGAGAPTIARSEAAAVVARCMEGKGYHKVYQPRAGWI